MVLADILLKLNKSSQFNLSFFHMNYNMHSKSELMEECCKNLALKNKTTFFNSNIDSDKIFNNRNIESKARKTRYEELKKICLKNKINYALTAHHEDDQIETIYMCQKKNSSWISSIGIREKKNLFKNTQHGVSLLRPMLTISKQSIIEYAKKNKLSFYDDPTNLNSRFFRNKIRLEISSKINDLRFRESLLKISKNNNKKFLRICSKIKDKKLKILFFSNGVDISILNKKEFLNENFDFFVLMFKDILNKEFSLNYRASTALWKNLFKFISTNTTGKSFDLNSQISVCDSSTFIYIYTAKPNPLNLKINSLGNYMTKLGTVSIMKSNKFIDYKDKKGLSIPSDCFDDLKIENWNHGDKCISNNNSTLKISDMFVNKKLSLFEKENYPIIKYRNTIIWIPGLFQGKLNIKSDNKFINLKWNSIL